MAGDTDLNSPGPRNGHPAVPCSTTLTTAARDPLAHTLELDLPFPDLLLLEHAHRAALSVPRQRMTRVSFGPAAKLCMPWLELSKFSVGKWQQQVLAPRGLFAEYRSEDQGQGLVHLPEVHALHSDRQRLLALAAVEDRIADYQATADGWKRQQPEVLSSFAYLSSCDRFGIVTPPSAYTTNASPKELLERAFKNNDQDLAYLFAEETCRRYGEDDCDIEF